MIPNAISIRTETETYFFATFLVREQAYSTLHQVWGAAKATVRILAALRESAIEGGMDLCFAAVGLASPIHVPHQYRQPKLNHTPPPFQGLLEGSLVFGDGDDSGDDHFASVTYDDDGDGLHPIGFRGGAEVSFESGLRSR